MGTSTPNGGTRGQGTPLIPSWLEQPPNAIFGTSTVIPEMIAPSFEPGSDSSQSVQDENSSVRAHEADKRRYTDARSNFTRFVTSSGANQKSLGRAISNYVGKVSGGSRKAAKRMGVSRYTGGNLLNVLSSIATQGLEETLKVLNLENLLGLPVEDIFLGLEDYICPEGSTTDASIAREAFVQTIVELAAQGITDLDALNIDQIRAVFELYTTRTIECKIYNEIGNNVIFAAIDIQEAENIQAQLHDFIKNSVADALTAAEINLDKLTPNKVLSFVDGVYETAFTLLDAMGTAQ